MQMLSITALWPLLYQITLLYCCDEAYVRGRRGLVVQSCCYLVVSNAVIREEKRDLIRWQLWSCFDNDTAGRLCD